jgi:hypothetical protein
MPRNRAIRVYVNTYKDNLVFVKGGDKILFPISWLNGVHTYTHAEEVFPEILGPYAIGFGINISGMNYEFGNGLVIDDGYVELS